MHYAAALLSSILFYFSSPAFSTQYIVFISLIPFFLSLNRSKSYKKVFIYGLIFGASLAALNCMPLYGAMTLSYGKGRIFSFLILLITVLTPLSLIYGLFSLIYKFFHKSKFGFHILIPPSMWIIFDYFMEHSGIFIPWTFPGYSLVNTLMIQPADITGIYGISFMIVLINSLAASVSPSQRTDTLKKAVLAAVIIVSAASYGLYRFAQTRGQYSDQKPIKVIIVQGNFTTEERWNSSSSALRYMKYIELTKNNAHDAGIVLWPETVLNSSDRINYEVIRDVTSFLSPSTFFIAGGTRKNREGKSYNSIFLSRGSNLLHFYDKHILFPYSESSYAGLTAGSFFDSPEFFQSGKGRSCWNGEDLNFGFSICFESVYPSYIRKSVKEGATLLINTANDSWFPGEIEPRLHLYRNMARAVEQRKYLIRASNTGISAIITPLGQTIAIADEGERAVLKGSVLSVTGKSFYGLTGDLIVIIGTVIMVFAALRAVLQWE